MATADIDTALGEYLIPGEAEILADFERMFREHFRRHYQGRPGVAMRAIHAKSHGCLRARFEVLDHRDPALAHGIFAAPGTYDAVVRVSNGDGPPGRDTDPIVSIGFAVKVKGVKASMLPEQTEPVQDFHFLNQPAYISADVRGYHSLMRAIDGGTIARLYAGIRNFRGIISRVRAGVKDDPLNTFYWGVSPFRLGSGAIKYLIRPSAPLPRDERRLRRVASADYLKSLLREHIESRDADYDFYIQKRLLDGNERREMPIEDFSVAWDETRAVPVLVARLRIPMQVPDETLDQAGEHMEFSPWNTTADLRPLGSLNRARRIVYALSASIRQEINRERGMIVPGSGAD